MDSDLSGRRSKVRRFAAFAPSPGLIEQILDDIRDAVMIAGEGGRLLYANAAAEALLARDGPLLARRGRIHGRDAPSEAALRRAIDRACADDPAGTRALVMNHPDQVPIVVVIKCVRQLPARAVLLTFDPHPGGARLVGRLRECFGLTRSEAEVAAAIAEGDAVARIAQRRGVALATIRTQVKMIAAKLGCARQAQIAAIVNAVPLAPEVVRP